MHWLGKFRDIKSAYVVRTFNQVWLQYHTSPWLKTQECRFHVKSCLGDAFLCKQREIFLEEVGGSQDKNELDNIVFNIATLYKVDDNNEMENYMEEFDQVTTGGAG